MNKRNNPYELYHYVVKVFEYIQKKKFTFLKQSKMYKEACITLLKGIIRDYNVFYSSYQSDKKRSSFLHNIASMLTKHFIINIFRLYEIINLG